MNTHIDKYRHHLLILLIHFDILNIYAYTMCCLFIIFISFFFFFLPLITVHDFIRTCLGF